MATPLQTVKSRFGSKEALVDVVLPLVERRTDESEAELRERLLRVSNQKLLRLVDRSETLKARFGSREALIEKIVQARTGHADADLTAKLAGQSTGRLLSQHK